MTWWHKGVLFPVNFVSAFMALVAYDVTAVLGFKAIRGCTRWMPVMPWTRDGCARDIIKTAVDEACIWYPTRSFCLKRSAVTVWLLRWSGVRAELVIGYRPAPVQTHAWVEIEKRVLNGPQVLRERFVQLDAV